LTGRGARCSQFVSRAPCFARALSRAALLLSLSLAVAACADDDEDTIQGTVHGTVRDADTGKPLKGVDVVFEADTLEQADDSTDGDGVFSMQVSAATPTGRLSASKSGYETRTVSVFLDDGDVAVDIDLEKN
jgi:hypothetical protein